MESREVDFCCCDRVELELELGWREVLLGCVLNPTCERSDSWLHMYLLRNPYKHQYHRITLPN